MPVSAVSTDQHPSAQNIDVSDPWETVQSGAVLVHFCPETIRRGIRAKEPAERLVAYRIGSTYRIRRSDLYRWLARKSEPIAPSPAKLEALEKARAKRAEKAQERRS